MLFAGLAAKAAGAGSGTVRGRVADEHGQPVPYANVLVKNTALGAAANGEGEYVLVLEPGAYTLVFSALGYETREVAIDLRNRETLQVNVTLPSASTQLGEFEVVADTRDKAKEIMKKVRDKRPFYLGRIDHYRCDTYLKTSLSKQRMKAVKGDSIDPAKIEVIRTDSVTDTVYKVERTNFIELSSTLFYKPPGQYREVIHAFSDHTMKSKKPYFGRSAYVEGDYDINIEADNIAPVTYAASNPYILYEDNTTAGINFYRNTIDFPAVAQKPLLSPIAESAPLSYRFDYEGFFYQDSTRIYKIRVSPIIAAEALFSGYVYIEDSTWALRSVSLDVNPGALFYCSEFHIEQQYAHQGDSIYVPVYRELTYTIRDGSNNVYGATRVRFSNYHVNGPLEEKTFGTEVKTFDPMAFDRDSAFWTEARPELLDASEIRFIDESDSIELYYVSDEYYHKLDSAFNRIDWWTPLIGLGHRNRVAGTEWYVEGLLGQVNLLGVGGIRYQLPVHFTKTFKNEMELETDVTPNYGHTNGDFKLKAGVGLTYVPKKFVSTYVEAGDFYDRINQYASIEQFFARSNYVSARTFGIRQRMEIVNGLFAELNYTYSNQQPIDNLRVSEWERILYEENIEPLPFEPYIKSEIGLRLQYRFRQKYFIKGKKKVIVGSDWPELFMNYRKGIPGLFRSEVNFDFGEMGLRDEVTTARYGTMNWRVATGTFLNKARLRVVEYKYFRGSDKIFFSDPTRSLQLLGPTFSTPYPFVEANGVHHFEGTLLNKVPGINKLKLELAVGGGALYISESDFLQAEVFGGLERVVRIKKQPIRFGLYAVTADNSVSTADYTLKFGINFFNTFTNKWDY